MSPKQSALHALRKGQLKIGNTNHMALGTSSAVSGQQQLHLSRGVLSKGAVNEMQGRRVFEALSSGAFAGDYLRHLPR